MQTDSDHKSRTATPTAHVPTTPGTEAWWKIRLPRNVLPVHYNVFLNVTVDLPRYDGNVEVEINVTSPTDLILIHSRGLNISHLTVRKKNSQGTDMDVVITYRVHGLHKSVKYNLVKL